MKTRFLTYLFSLYFLLLAVMPCTDYTVCAEDLVEHVDNHQAEEGHDHSDPESDICSPFCLCDCCGISLMQTGILMWHPRVFTHSIAQSDVIEGHIPSPTFPIWQPPKIVS